MNFNLPKHEVIPIFFELKLLGYRYSVVYTLFCTHLKSGINSPILYKNNKFSVYLPMVILSGRQNVNR